MRGPDPVRLEVVNFLGSGICVSVTDGNALYSEIVSAFQKKRQVELSFLGVSRLTTAFLNAAVGQLYNEYSEDDVRKWLLPPKGSSEHLALLKRVVDNAKRFFADRARISSIVTDVRGDD